MNEGIERTVMSCTEARTVMDSLLSLSPEYAGRVWGHILACDGCAIALGEAAARRRAASMPVALGHVWRGHRGTTPLAGNRSRGEGIWRLCRDAYSTTPAPARQRAQSVRARGARHRAQAPKAVPVSLRFCRVDDALRPVAEEDVAVDMVSGPLITKDGAFELTMQFGEDEARRFEGMTVYCCWILDEKSDADGRITFEGAVTDGIIRIQAGGLPCPDAEVWLEPERLEFSIASRFHQRPNGEEGIG